jgi:heat shock protein HspQ
MRRLRCGLRLARRANSPFPGARLTTMDDKIAKFRIGQVVRHRIYPFRGVVFDVDPVFNSTEEWWESIPEDVRPRKDQPFYHLLAENESSTYIAYVSEQNLLVDESGEPVQHPQISDLFGELQAGQYAVLDSMMH